MPVTRKKSAYNVNVLERAFKILDAYAEPGQEPDVADLIARLDIPKSTVHRLLVVLERHGYLERSPVTGRYHLGARLVALGMHAVGRIDLASVAAPFLQRLVDETGETTHLGVLRDGEIISILHAQGRHVLRPPSTVGRRVPLHCTSLGKAILAFLPEGEADELIAECRFTPFTAHTITGASLLRAELQRVRDAGYAMDDEEFEEGLKCMGAPIRDYSGRVVAALSIPMPGVRMKPERVPELARVLIGVADHLSKALRYPGDSAGRA